LLTPAQIELIVGIVRTYTDAEILLFGSRATGRARRYSDVDLCLRLPEKLPFRALAMIRGDLEESNLPYIVDVADYHRMTAAFQRAVDRDGIVLSPGP
jgi:predicted nucleotidyltransferase